MWVLHRGQQSQPCRGSWRSDGRSRLSWFLFAYSTNRFPQSVQTPDQPHMKILEGKHPQTLKQLSGKVQWNVKANNIYQSWEKVTKQRGMFVVVEQPSTFSASPLIHIPPDVNLKSPFRISTELQRSRQQQKYSDRQTCKLKCWVLLSAASENSPWCRVRDSRLKDDWWPFGSASERRSGWILVWLVILMFTRPVVLLSLFSMKDSLCHKHTKSKHFFHDEKRAHTVPSANSNFYFFLKAITRLQITF